MFEIDKTAFGKFVAEQRKEKGYTQKQLAEKLFVSDKAVSKWERALSMPDISLLIPLADILEVAVTELLEGKKLDGAAEMSAGQVEVLVKKALTFSEETPEKKKEHRRRNAAVFGGCTLLAALEVLAGIWGLSGIGIDALFMSTYLWVMEGLSLVFGIYFWIFMKERLPAYYDENKISAYSDGVFRMNIPGVAFNNSNWPHMVKSLQKWSAVTMVAVPIVWLLSVALAREFWLSFLIQNVVLILYLAGMFVPLYVVGRKYG